MAGMAVVSIPAIPEGWHGRDVVRLVDPLGCVAGWIAPAMGGVLIGCHARLDNPAVWHPIGIARTSDAIFPFEPLIRTDNDVVQPLRTLGSDWRLHVRDPTGAIVRGIWDDRMMEISTELEDAGMRMSVRFDGEIDESRFAFALPPRWQQPAGTLPFDIEEGGDPSRKTLALTFHAPNGAR
jgi:hypothetical protein